MFRQCQERLPVYEYVCPLFEYVPDLFHEPVINSLYDFECGRVYFGNNFLFFYMIFDV